MRPRFARGVDVGCDGRRSTLCPRAPCSSSAPSVRSSLRPLTLSRAMLHSLWPSWRWDDGASCAIPRVRSGPEIAPAFPSRTRAARSALRVVVFVQSGGGVVWCGVGAGRRTQHAAPVGAGGSGGLAEEDVTDMRAVSIVHTRASSRPTPLGRSVLGASRGVLLAPSLPFVFIVVAASAAPAGGGSSHVAFGRFCRRPTFARKRLNTLWYCQSDLSFCVYQYSVVSTAQHRAPSPWRTQNFTVSVRGNGTR
jgi:hypothetical protein